MVITWIGWMVELREWWKNNRGGGLLSEWMDG